MSRIAIAFLLAGAAAAMQDKQPPLTKVQEIVLEGGPAFDYVSIDSASERAYVGHHPKIDVVDLKGGRKIGEVEGVDGAHGAVVVADVKRGFATAGRKNKLVVFDLESLKVTKEIDTGKGPDALLYVSTAKEVWTFNAHGNSVTCVDVATLEVKSTIEVEGELEAAVEDEARGLVYLNMEDKSEIAVLDIKKHSLVGTHPVDPGKAPTGLAFDAKNGLLFSGCRSKKLVVIDASSWKVVASLDIGPGVDGVVYDPDTGNVFASCADAVAAAHVKDAKTVEALPSLEKGGKTCGLDLKTHKLYLTRGPKRGEKGNVTLTVFAPR